MRVVRIYIYIYMYSGCGHVTLYVTHLVLSAAAVVVVVVSVGGSCYCLAFFLTMARVQEGESRHAAAPYAIQPATQLLHTQISLFNVRFPRNRIQCRFKATLASLAMLRFG